jgi:hypothetical protein
MDSIKRLEAKRLLSAVAQMVDFGLKKVKNALSFKAS